MIQIFGNQEKPCLKAAHHQAADRRCQLLIADLLPTDLRHHRRCETVMEYTKGTYPSKAAAIISALSGLSNEQHSPDGYQIVSALSSLSDGLAKIFATEAIFPHQSLKGPPLHACGTRRLGNVSFEYR